MTGLLLRWRAVEPIVELRWRGPEGLMQAISRTPLDQLAAFIVPAAVANLTGGEGIELIGSDIRISIDELPLAKGI